MNDKNLERQYSYTHQGYILLKCNSNSEAIEQAKDMCKDMATLHNINDMEISINKGIEVTVPDIIGSKCKRIYDIVHWAGKIVK